MASRKLIPIILIISAIYCVSSRSENVWINGEVLETFFEHFIETDLGTSDFQDYIERKHLEEKQLDGTHLLNKLVSITKKQFQDISNAVSRIQSTVQNDYQTGLYNKTLAPNDSRQCCMSNVHELIMSYEFMKKVDPRQMCMRISKDAEENPVIPLSDNLLEVMQKNRQENKDIKWQYFGTEEGVYVKYPRQADQKCNDYDPRYRSWYAEAVTEYPKDVVILFDRSKRIENRDLLSAIKNASDALIQTLNADDRLAMVAFNEETSQPPGEKTGQYCYYEEFAFATPETKEYFKKWYHGLAGEGFSDYKKAFSAAFMYFIHSRNVTNDPRPRSRVIIFLTDGVQDWSSRAGSGQILDDISKSNAELNNTVIITTYGIDENMSTEEEMLLRNISLQTKADTDKGEVKPGQFVKITSTRNLRVQVGSYYNSLNEWQNVKPVITTPYVDFSGLGMVISVCLPVNISHQLKGVTCVDLSLEAITSSFASIHHGRNAYAIKYDYKGRVILHPLMPDAVAYDRIIYLDINDLERSTEFKQIMNDVNRNISGSMSFMKNFTQSRGNTTTDGVKTESHKATYYWASAVDFNIVLVISDRDVNITVPPPGLYSNRFTYHRLDLVDDVQKCSSYGRLSTTESSVVKLTRDAFQRKLYYNEPDTKEKVAIYKSYMEAPDQQNNDKLKYMTKQMVAISEHLETIWSERRNMSGVVIWRYYGDYYGHVRIYPGVTLPSDYDHTKRSFFLKSVNNKDVITITPPYLDAFGAGIVASVVVPIFHKSPNNQNNVEKMTVLGVMAVDIKLQFIKKTLETLFPVCLESDKACFIMDTSGYLIYHSETNYIEDDKINEVYSFHLTELEPEIATYLIEERFLVGQSCIDFGYKNVLRTWRVENVNRINTYDKRPYFDMYKVPGTNLFIAITDKSHPPQASCSCPIRTLPIHGTLYPCTDNQCTCPCVDDVNYDYCNNKFLYDTIKWPACVPQPNSIGFKTPIAEEKQTVGNLTPCFKCEYTEIESVCKLLESCSWCADTCIQGQCPENKELRNKGLLIGLTVGGGMLLFVFIILLLIYAKRHRDCVGNKGRVPKPGTWVPDSEEPSSSAPAEGHPASTSRYYVA